MATATFRHKGSGDNVKQAKTFTITGVSTSTTATWTLTLTRSDGTTATVSYTEDGSPTIAEIVTGLKDAWNDSIQPDVSDITASEANGTDVILTADTAGVPFDVTLADDDDGTHTAADTTASIGHKDYGTAANWSTDAVPVAGDDVVFPEGSTSVLYGLDQSGVAIADFSVQQGCSSGFGQFKDGIGFYLRLDPNTFTYRGNGQLAMFSLETGGTQIDPLIVSEGSASSVGLKSLYIKGDNIGDLEVQKGNIGVGLLPGDTATINQILCGFTSSPTSDVDMEVGTGVTLTTLEQSGGRCVLRCAATTVNVRSGAELTTADAGAITTMNVHGTVFPNSTGTISTMNLFGTCDFSRDRSARTVSTLNLKPGAKLILHSGITITTLNLPTDPGSVTIIRV